MGNASLPSDPFEKTCFVDLPAEILDQLQFHKTRILFRKGDILLKQGLTPTSVMFIVSGMVREYIEGPMEKNRNLRILTKGNFIGLSGLFNNDPSNYSVMAVKDSWVCVMDAKFLFGIIQTNPEFAFKLVKRYSELENSFFSLLRNNLFKQMNGKIADTLLYLSSPEYLQEEIFLYLSRKDLAEFAAVTTENLIRILKNLEKEKIISLNNKEIIILDKDALIRISQTG